MSFVITFLACSRISFSPSTTLSRITNLPLHIIESTQSEWAEYMKLARNEPGDMKL